MMKNYFLVLSLLIAGSFWADGDGWNVIMSKNYQRITDCIIRDLDKDGFDEIVLSYFAYSGKKIDVYKYKDGLVLTDTFNVPEYTVFFDAGDIDNDGTPDIVFLTSDGLYYAPINLRGTKSDKSYKIQKNIRSEIVVPQPQLLTNVPMVIDMDGNGKNDLVVENVRQVEIYETSAFQSMGTIKLDTMLEFSIIPGEFYPHYIFYTLPIIQVVDLDNNGVKEIITKFPRSMNVYSMKSDKTWQLNNIIKVEKDNIYFLSNSFIKFSFPVIEDVDGDNMREVIISAANLDMPRIKFEAVGDMYYLDKTSFKTKSTGQLIIKGIPLNLPVFYNITDKKTRDLICPVVPFNLFSIFNIFNGSGDLKVPFYHYVYKDGKYLDSPAKLFTISFKIENVMSFVEELPFDQVDPYSYPDFYYFKINNSKLYADIQYFHHSTDKNGYGEENIARIDMKKYRADLPSTLKIGRFSNKKRKDVMFITSSNFYLVVRK